MFDNQKLISLYIKINNELDNQKIAKINMTNNKSEKQEKFKFLEHTADIKFQVFGETLAEIFENSVLAFANYVSNDQKISSGKGKIINVSGEDSESLLYNFFDELIYLLDAENFIATKAKVTLRGNNLKAELFGDSASKYEGLKQIKAATYAEMFIKKLSSGNWQAQVVLDV